jgi:adenylate cyclase
VDKVRVKGKLEGIVIFAPVGAHGTVGDDIVAEIDRFHEALKHYRGQRWDEAERRLRDLAQAAPESKLYALYIERIAWFRAHPPDADWDGVFVFTTK